MRKTEVCVDLYFHAVFGKQECPSISLREVDSRFDTRQFAYGVRADG